MSRVARLESMSEKDWQAQVIEIARMLRWRVAHFRSVLTKHGWQTPVQGDGVGFPDLILVRDRILAVELKTDTGKVADEQLIWLTAFETAHIETHIWRPRDAEEVLATLRRRTPA